MENLRDYCYDMVADGLLTPTDMMIICLKWMSQDDIRAMLKTNELSPEFIGGEE